MKYCEEYAALLSSFADNELEAAEEAEVLAHLEVCEECRAYLAGIMEMKEVFSTDVPELPENFAAQVMWHVRKEKTKKQKKSRRITAAGSIAACLVLVLALPQILDNVGMAGEDAAESDTAMDGFFEGSLEGSDAAAPEASEDPGADAGMDTGVAGSPGVNGSYSAFDQDTEAAKENCPTVTVDAALMEEWLEKSGSAVFRAESAEGKTEYYLEEADYEGFALFMAEKEISVPELGESEFLVVRIQ